MKHQDQLSGAEPPDEKARPKLRAPDRVAAGMHALFESLKFTARETGFIRGIKDWLKKIYKSKRTIGWNFRAGWSIRW